MEEELTKILLLDSGLEETDGAFNMIRNIVGQVQHVISKKSAGKSLKKFSTYSHENLCSPAQLKGRHWRQNC